jgi:hypothetical protein
MDQTFRFHQVVETPNGDGVIQGRLNESDGSIRILVSHKPHPTLPDSLMRSWRGGPWILYAYDLKDIHPK